MDMSLALDLYFKTILFNYYIIYGYRINQVTSTLVFYELEYLRKLLLIQPVSWFFSTVQ